MGKRYWEIIRFYEKIFIMIISISLTNKIKEKALVINLVLILYITLVLYIRPYRTKILNKIDLGTSLVCFFSIYFGLIASSEDDKKGIFFILGITLIITLNLPTLIYLVYLIIASYKSFL